MKAEAARRPRLVWAAGVVVMVLAGLAGLGIFIAKQPYGYDLWAYVLAARHLLAGEPLYAAQPEVPFGPFGEYHYAPPAAVPFMLLAPLPFWLATALWIAVNAAIAAAIAVHLIRPLPRDARPWAAAAFVLFLPTILEIALGNLNLVTVALCLLAWSLRQRSAAAGTILAIAIGLKLLPLTLVLFYLASGRGRVVAWTLVVGLVGLVVTALVFARDFPAYVALLIALKDSHWAADLIASTPPAEVAALLGSPIGRWLLPVAALGTATLGGLAARRGARDETHLHHLALAFAPYLASFGLLWFPYLCTALPLMASTFHRALLVPRAATRGALVAALALSWLLLQIVGERNDLVPIGAHFLGLLVLLAVALAVLVPVRSRDIPESVAARVAA
ncbi:MAG TPA: glycosyltransferase family 87 protein [Candidatus Limnocylindria bacterium]|nr:glycosyltransferase family 87 protein [Candidatus Limnocylindria bacterium]